MNEVYTPVFALAFFMALMLLVGGFMRTGPKIGASYTYATGFQRVVHKVLLPAVVILTSALLGLVCFIGIESGKCVYAMMALFSLATRFPIPTLILILLNFYSLQHCIMHSNRMANAMYYTHILNFIMLVTPSTLYAIDGP